MSLSSSPLRLGTRSSKLAIRQAELTRAALIAADPALATPGRIEIVPMHSSGDWKPGQQERSFAQLGGNKGLFAKELEAALRDGHIDLAVHSAKDLETALTPGLTLAAFMPRDDARDAFISPHGAHPRDLPPGARVGTSSLRRAAQILHLRPDLVVVPLRGNVDTRLRKLQEGMAEATLLALCGLQRLGLDEYTHHPLDTADMLPAVAQGALAIEIRDERGALQDLVRRISCPFTAQCVTLERLFLAGVNGSCHTPVAALATLRPDRQIDFTALVARTDGSAMEKRHAVWHPDTAAAAAAELGRELRGYLPPALLS